MLSDRLARYCRSAAWIIQSSWSRVIERTYAPPAVLSVEQTMLEILKNKRSVSRYGDGELNLMMGRGTGFQPFSAELSSRLREIILSEEPGLLICIPDVFAGLEKYRPETQAAWGSHLLENRHAWYRLVDRQRAYYNAFISRCYYIWADKSRSAERFAMMREIWKERDVVLVEGEKSRVGVGNDLFENARSIRRILAPAVDAFSKYGDILQAVSTQDPKNLVLIALGPTATVLAHDLHKLGYQAVDIGHLDIEYEWYRRNAPVKVRIDKKYVNEVPGGEKVGDMFDGRYLQQIAQRIR